MTGTNTLVVNGPSNIVPEDMINRISSRKGGDFVTPDYHESSKDRFRNDVKFQTANQQN